MLRALFPLLTLLALSLPVSAAPTPAAPVQGSDYAVIEGGTPYQPTPGRVEVAEVFGYTCPHCAHFEAPLEAWVARLPRGTRFVPVPAAFGGYWTPYARAYFAAQALHVAERSHAAMFRALHDEHSLPISDASPAEIAAFYTHYGIPAPRFIAAYNAPVVDAQLQHAREFIERSDVDGTPTLVVAGKYRVMGKTLDETLRTARWLVDRELTTRPRR